MKKYIYAFLTLLLMFTGCEEYHPYYDGQLMCIYQKRYGVIEENGVHLYVPIVDRNPYDLEIYGGKGKNHKVTVSDPDVLTYTYKEADVETFLGEDIIPATLTLEPKRLGDTSIEISDLDTGESISVELHVVKTLNMMEVYDTHNSLDIGVVLAFEYPSSSDDIKICRRDQESGDLEYILDAKCRFHDGDTTLVMALEYLADEKEQPDINGTPITKKYNVDFADGYTYGGASYILRVMNLSNITLHAGLTKAYYEEESYYDSRLRFHDITDEENPDPQSPDAKVFYMRSAQLKPWIE